MKTHVCGQCKVEKALTQDNFHLRSARPLGFFGTCKECKRKRKYWKSQDQDKRRTSARNWRLSEKGKRWMRRCSLGRYGLTEEQFDALWEAQGGNCPVCHQPLDKPVIDHDHDTEKVRGLLHGRCNSVLGFANEDANVLQGAIEYLRKHKKQQ